MLGEDALQIGRRLAQVFIFALTRRFFDFVILLSAIF